MVLCVALELSIWRMKFHPRRDIWSMHVLLRLYVGTWPVLPECRG